MDKDKVLMALKKQRSSNSISKQQYKTFKGQVLSGDVLGAAKGLNKLMKRKQDVTGITTNHMWSVL